jgi:hypothetical protein
LHPWFSAAREGRQIPENHHSLTWLSKNSFSIESAGAARGASPVTKEWQRRFEAAQRRPA